MRMTLQMTLVVPVVLVLCWSSSQGQDKPAANLKQDRQKLKGTWQTADWRKPDAKGWQCSIQVGVLEDADDPRFSLTINLEREGKSTSGPVLGALVLHKVKGDKRWMTWHNPESAKEQKLPTDIIYRFDDEDLVLTLPEGVCKGEYILKQVKNK